MTSEQQADYVSQARREIEAVNDEAGLVQWESAWVETPEYFALSQDNLQAIEGMFQDRIRWVLGVGA